MMNKLSERRLREIIKEEYLKGIPDFVVLQAAEELAEKIKASLVKYTLLNKSTSQEEKQRVARSIDATVNDLESRVREVIKEHIWQFLRHV
jgi:hypothetical protein